MKALQLKSIHLMDTAALGKLYAEIRTELSVRKKDRRIEKFLTEHPRFRPLALRFQKLFGVHAMNVGGVTYELAWIAALEVDVARIDASGPRYFQRKEIKTLPQRVRRKVGSLENRIKRLCDRIEAEEKRDGKLEGEYFGNLEFLFDSAEVTRRQFYREGKFQ